MSVQGGCACVWRVCSVSVEVVHGGGCDVCVEGVHGECGGYDV